MAKVSNAFDSFTAVGNREDLTDFISDISPLEAPAHDRWGTVKATNRYHEWQVDSLATATSNAYVEGESFAGAARTATTRYGSHCQLQIKMFSITDTQNIIDKAGRNSESAYQLTKAAKELKRDFEWTIMVSAITNSASGASGATNVAPIMQNVNMWQVKVLAHTGISGQASAATITEAQFNKDLLQAAWNNGARINTVYVGGSLKRLFAGWAATAGRPREMGDSRRIVDVVDYYVSDFGELEIVLDRYVASQIMYCLDDTLWKKADLVPTRSEQIAKTGLASNHMMWRQWTLENRNPTGNAMGYSGP
jgi:hypothetical protein